MWLKNEHTYCIIMAGGVGSRFWPMSREAKPKQFLDVLGTGKSLLKMTFDRLSYIAYKNQIYIVTNAQYKDLTIEELGINPSQVLLEPIRRNTALCIAYAAYKILRKDPKANIMVCPSDHLILQETNFIQVASKALEYIRSNDALLTLGIKPSRPDTGYGYIQIAGKADNTNEDIMKVKTFTEKPDLAMARIFVDSGEFLWNSGMFFFSIRSIINAFEQHMPTLSKQFQQGFEKLDTPKETGMIAAIYAQSKSISIDYAIMEHADNVYVIPADFGWSDIGTWNSLYEVQRPDKNKNAVLGRDVYLYDTSGCQVCVSPNRLAVLKGLKDMIVVQTEDALLICPKSEEQSLKDIVNDIKLNGGERYI